MRKFLLMILLAGCTRNSGEKIFISSYEQSSKPTVVIEPVEDSACTFSSLKVAQSLTTNLLERLEQKELFSIQSTGRFLVQMQLIELQETEGKPPELSMSVHVKMSDRTLGKVILQEVLVVNTLLEPAQPKAEEQRISPLGLATLKLTRTISERMEDYILGAG